MARVEEGVEHVETKLDHHGQTLERIEQSLADDLAEKDERLSEVEPKVRRLWTYQQLAKWLVMVGSGGGVLALLVTLAAGGAV
jgi:prefoldin subunit 5